jgi:DNA polymerase III subunit chi
VTTVDFYFNAADAMQTACRLAGKAIAQKKRLLVYAPEPDSAQRLDRLLWSWPAVGFVPHCAAHDALAADTPVLIAADTEAAHACELLLNLSRECPPHFERFDRLLEIVGDGEDERKAARARYAFYRDRGYRIRNHDLAGGAARKVGGADG